MSLNNYVILVGNPGVGKSTILNSLVEDVKFRAGLSYGSGLTSKLQLVQHGDTIYGDTPGLSDVNLREQAAAEIREILRQHGYYKLIFVVTVEAGRVRPDDITTMKLVLDAIDDSSFPYGIIVNKATPKIMRDANDEAAIAPLLLQLNYGRCPTDMIFFGPRLDALEDGENVLAPADEDLVRFIKEMTPKVIEPSQVKEINIQDFDGLREQYEKEITELKSNMQLQEAEHKRQMVQYRRKHRRSNCSIA